MATDVPWLRDKIRDIPDYPQPGVTFRDITPLLGAPAIFGRAVDDLVSQFHDVPVDRVVGIESRGFILAAPVAYRMRAGFVPVRKAGKLPWAVAREEYELEYGTDARCAHERILDLSSYDVDAGDIGAGHSVTALYEVRLVPGADPAAALATVSLRWADVDTGDVTELSAELTAADITGAFTEAPGSLQRAAVAGYYAEVLRASPFVAERGVTMVEVDQAAQSVRRAHGDGDRFDELVDLVSEAAALGASR